MDRHQRSNFCPTCHGLFSSRTVSRLTTPPRPRSGVRTSLSCFWAKEARPGNSPDLIADRKSVRDRATQGGQDGNCDVRSQPHPECPVGLAQYFIRNAGQPDVRDAEAYESLCGKSWRLYQHINQDPAILCFLDIAGDRMANQFRNTLYICYSDMLLLASASACELSVYGHRWLFVVPFLSSHSADDSAPPKNVSIPLQFIHLMTNHLKCGQRPPKNYKIT